MLEDGVALRLAGLVRSGAVLALDEAIAEGGSLEVIVVLSIAALVALRLGVANVAETVGDRPSTR